MKKVWLLLGVIVVLLLPAGCSSGKSVKLVAKWQKLTLPVLQMGAATNPVIKGDAPDPSLIRVGDAYYMISTTMYFTPVAPVMKSYDLVNWKIVSYCTDILEDLPEFKLEAENAERIGDYGRGQWASSLRYFNRRFWVVFTNNTTNKTYVFSTRDPDNEPWERKEINRRFHDPSVFQDPDTGKVYMFQGYGEITLTEMAADLSGVRQGGLDITVIPSANNVGCTNMEGAHAYKLNGYYYVFVIAWLSGRRVELCYRSERIDGPYEGRVVLNKTLGGRSDGVAQGCIVDTPDGQWYGFIFQDRGAVGRIPVLVPMRWGGDLWPVFGDENGNIPEEFQIKLAVDYEQNLYVSDEFDKTTLPLAWQWNHNPDNANWSLTERPGYLRLTTGRTSKTIYHARNTLTQRTFEPACEGTVALEPANMKDGDIAGLVVLQALSGFVGIEQEDGQKYIVMYTGDNESTDKRGMNAAMTRAVRVPFTGDKVYFRAKCQFRSAGSAETAVFSYSPDGTAWQNIGTTVSLRWTMRHFTGYRFGLFNYATKEAGGYVDFDYFHVE